MPRPLLLVGLLLGCQPAHHVPGGPSWPVPHAAIRTNGCLDLGFAIEGPIVSTSREGRLTVRVGNRCGRGVPFDLRRLSIVALHGDAPGKVALDDPRHEIEELHVAPYVEAAIRLRVVAEHGSLASHVCIDASAVVTDAPQAPTPPVCFVQAGHRWRAL